MNVQTNPTTDREDLDSTAELPVLDIAALETHAAEERNGSTDTWIIPPPTLRVASEVVDSPPSADARTELETNLRALSANLGDLEDRLKRKVAQLAENELALEAARAERSAIEERAQRLERDLSESRASEAAAQQSISELQHTLRERAASAEEFRARDADFTTKAVEHQRVLTAIHLELSESRAHAASYLEVLQTTEGRRNLFHNMFSGLQLEIDAGESQVARLRAELAAGNASARDLNLELNQRAQRILHLEKEVNTFATSLAQRDEKLLQMQGESEELQRNLTVLNERVTVGTERIRTLEAAATRLGESSMQRLAEIERTAKERDGLRAKIAELESAVADVTVQRDGHEKSAAESQAKVKEHEVALSAERKRAVQLDSELMTVRAEMQEWASTIQKATAERSENTAKIAAREERIKELEARVDEQQDTVRTLQADSNASVARAKELEADLRVAEEAIHRLESDLRNKNARLDELERTNHEWHSRVDEARVALSDRDKLIQRLEDEAANSSVLIGQIQQSMKRLDPSVSGTHEALPEGATRLLIRVDGDSEVVHVLGRKTSIGRTPDNDLQIDAKFISRHHAVILAGPARTIVEDLNSTNGVLVNGRRVTRQVLQDGDAVVVGRTQFRFALRTTSSR